MSPSLLLGIAVGALGTAAIVLAVWLLRARREPGPALLAEPTDGTSSLPEGAQDVLAVLASITVVVDETDRVVSAAPSATAYGLVRRNNLAHQEILALVRAVREDREIRESTLRISRGPLRGTESDRLLMTVRVTPLGDHHVLILIQDRTYADRIEMVRRDFVANVSHELKTPVGGLSLLAEAVLDAKDDPVAVERFASRMQVEAKRLSRLVTDVVDLTRLQVADSLHEPVPVDVGAVVREAVDSSSVAADAKDISLDTVIEHGLVTFGDEDLLVTAVRNLVINAVNYSGSGTRVAVSARSRDDSIEIVVADHGQGIPLAEQERIFERFYRIDPARSRATGGTGLGLSIVKHICATHGGAVSVWSQEGKGSTFTITLPLHRDSEVEVAGDRGDGLMPGVTSSALGVAARDSHTRHSQAHHSHTHDSQTRDTDARHSQTHDSHTQGAARA